jgi:hypothetical protein
VSGSLTGNQPDNDEVEIEARISESVALMHEFIASQVGFDGGEQMALQAEAAIERVGLRSMLTPLLAEVRRLHDENEQLRRTVQAVRDALNYDNTVCGYNFGTVEKARIRAALAGLVSRPDEEPRPSVTPQEKPE